ncbi:hypothetical protein FA15DRAFT_701547 [Coprinopsis marcescibilis]|uniref:Uncharacterized protein n=1 Tax=Coprinopsis marcescibilis TaxID=230819 RepID=A0A5C3L5L2_COPMA|nr:hypothetical protein FA15DRAFT_701547 [Coprinopsis marcescibilis]
MVCCAELSSNPAFVFQQPPEQFNHLNMQFKLTSFVVALMTVAAVSATLLPEAAEAPAVAPSAEVVQAASCGRWPFPPCW